MKEVARVATFTSLVDHAFRKVPNATQIGICHDITGANWGFSLCSRSPSPLVQCKQIVRLIRRIVTPGPRRWLQRHAWGGHQWPGHGWVCFAAVPSKDC